MCLKINTRVSEFYTESHRLLGRKNKDLFLFRCKKGIKKALNFSAFIFSSYLLSLSQF